MQRSQVVSQKQSGKPSTALPILSWKIMGDQPWEEDLVCLAPGRLVSDSVCWAAVPTEGNGHRGATIQNQAKESDVEGKPLYLLKRCWWTGERNLTLTIHLLHAKQYAFIFSIATNHILSEKLLIILILQMRKLRLDVYVMCTRTRLKQKMSTFWHQISYLVFSFVFGFQVLRVIAKHFFCVIFSLYLWSWPWVPFLSPLISTLMRWGYVFE